MQNLRIHLKLILLVDYLFTELMVFNNFRHFSAPIKSTLKMFVVFQLSVSFYKVSFLSIRRRDKVRM